MLGAWQQHQVSGKVLGGSEYSTATAAEHPLHADWANYSTFAA
jgi:hypothetical protein